VRCGSSCWVSMSRRRGTAVTGRRGLPHPGPGTEPARTWE
jgi:hypothetical protein